jgi:hypothetical protein
MKITEVRKIAKNMRINIKNKDGELRTKESLLRSINKKIVKGGTLTNINEQLKKKCELYAELYDIQFMDELKSKFPNYSDLYRILQIYSWEYEYNFILLDELMTKDEIKLYVKERLDSLLKGEYKNANKNRRNKIAIEYITKIDEIFQIQAYRKYKNKLVQNKNNKNKLKDLFEVLEMSGKDINDTSKKIRRKPFTPNQYNLLSYPEYWDYVSKFRAREFHYKVYMKLSAMKRAIEKLSSINTIIQEGNEGFSSKYQPNNSLNSNDSNKNEDGGGGGGGGGV